MRKILLLVALMFHTACTTLFGPPETCESASRTKVDPVLIQQQCFMQVDINLYRQAESGPPTEEYVFACAASTVQIVVVPETDPLAIEALMNMKSTELGKCRVIGKADYRIYSIITANLKRT